VTPKQLIDERVCLEAQRLLVHTRWPLTRICAELGFCEPTNFVKFFRRTTGQTPEQFRRKPVVQGSK
jgi:AraC family transcriptional regulator, transcriptional activator of pobA